MAFIKDRKEKREQLIKNKVTEGIQEIIKQGGYPSFNKVLESQGIDDSWGTSFVYKHYRLEIIKCIIV